MTSPTTSTLARAIFSRSCGNTLFIYPGLKARFGMRRTSLAAIIRAFSVTVDWCRSN
jgi:hypothetical protein